MAVYDQPITSYSDTTPHERAIADVIKIIDPVDTPLIAALGGLDAARSKFEVRQNSYKIEILEDEYDPLITACTTATTAPDGTAFSVADGSMFQDGHVIKIAAEYMVVASVSGNEVTVLSRSYGGTSTTIAATAAIEIVGMARLEGDDATYGPIVDITAPYNYTSIFEKAIQVSGTQQVIDQYGIDDEFAYQSAKAVPHMLRLVEKMAFHGIRDAGSASAPRSAGGLLTYITDNTVAAGGGLAKTDVDNLAEYITLDGGSPDLLVMNPSVANDMRALIDSSSFVRVDQENTMFGMMPITRVATQYGMLRLVESRWCPLALSFMLDSRKVGFYTLRPFFSKPLAVTGDSVKGEVVGEFSLLVANDKAHGWISGLTS
jgi:hypothetical protein